LSGWSSVSTAPVKDWHGEEEEGGIRGGREKKQSSAVLLGVGFSFKVAFAAVFPRRTANGSDCYAAVAPETICNSQELVTGTKKKKRGARAYVSLSFSLSFCFIILISFFFVCTRNLGRHKGVADAGRDHLYDRPGITIFGIVTFCIM
jgi:hypothetical protein